MARASVTRGRPATRSFLFLAFGLAIASMEELPLWIPENGFASLNLPLTADQRGSLSTRTTHPLFLEQLGGPGDRRRRACTDREPAGRNDQG